MSDATTDRNHHLTTDQLNSTALKWGSDGELSELDFDRIMHLLTQSDPAAEALIETPIEPSS